MSDSYFFQYFDENNTNSYLSILGNIVKEYLDTDIYEQLETAEKLDKKNIIRNLWRRFAKTDKLLYLETEYNSVLIKMETPSAKRLNRFIDKNADALQSRFFDYSKIVQNFLPAFSKKYIGSPIKENLINLSTYIFNLANDNDKSFFENEQKLLELIIILYFQENYLQWLIEMMDFVSEKKNENNENDKIRLWIDGVESKGNKDERMQSKFKINLKKGAKIDLIRILVAMYDNGFFESETKQKVDLINVMKTFGDVLGVDFSDYDNSLSTGFQSKIETNLKVFETLKQAIQKRYNKRLEK